MAAVSELRTPEIVELREISDHELSRLLEEEKLAWRSQLYWDFTASADLVRRFVRIQALTGYALVAGGRCIGYSYFVSEDGKALIGDLYVVRDLASAQLEDALLTAVLNALMNMPTVRRIEAQLMMLHGAFERNLPYSRYMRVYPRNLMLMDLQDAAALQPGSAAQAFTYANWSEQYQEEGARLIAAAYRGHVDAKINDQYRTITGGRRFLNNIVQYPGCGAFHRPASWVALAPGQYVRGLSLASLVAEHVGHITQICVAPEVKGIGLGYELLRRSLGSLGEAGAEQASLTVTASNQSAMNLYENVGFHAKRRFAAYVWEGL